MYVGLQANTSRLAFSTSHIDFFPSSVRFPTIMTDFSGYSGWIATFMFSVGSGGGATICQTIWISSGLALSLLIVATPALVGNFIMPCAVDGTAPRALAESSSETTTKGYMENYKNISQDIHDQLNAEAEAVQIILTGIDNDIYSTVDACPNACEMFYKMMNKLVRNQCDVTNHQVNVQFLLKLQPEWQRFVTLVKQSQELKTVSYHKLYDILKQHQNEVSNLQYDYLETLEKCEHLKKELSKSRTLSKSFEALQKHAINLELDLQQCKEKIKK
ncbi:hypothetical protein Tco_0888293 [Tanacetum coccineum]